MTDYWKSCERKHEASTKHVSLCFKDVTRQRYVLDIGKLVKKAMADFPKLDKLAIVVEVAGNTQCPKQIGIGFYIPAETALPEGYTESILV